MKRIDIMLREYASRQNLESLRYLSGRLNRRVGDDLPEAINAMTTSGDLDRWLSGARGCFDFYDMVDMAQDAIDNEIRRRIPDLVEA